MVAQKRIGETGEQEDFMLLVCFLFPPTQHQEMQFKISRKAWGGSDHHKTRDARGLLLNFFAAL
jgi:hypothetical protein